MSELAIAKTFYESAARLGNRDRARVFDFMGKYHANPANPGISLERVTQARNSSIWSARITQGLRAIVHKDGGRSTLLYAGKHDDAYNWAARRSLYRHPVTGVLQIVETIEEAERDLARASGEVPASRLFSADEYEDAYLVSLGVPEDWLPTVRRVADPNQLAVFIERLPEEVVERLIELADGNLVTPPKPVAPLSALQASPDNLRRFFIIENDADLADVLNQPLEVWIRFLHPSQRSLAEGSFAGPFKVTGSAGTGKTVVALHRARNLARKGKHVLLTTFAKSLCRNLERNLRILCRPGEFSRIKVATVHSQAFRIARTAHPKVRALSAGEVLRLVERSLERAGVDLDRGFQLERGFVRSVDRGFMRSEWTEVIDRQGLTSWEAYRDADRRGRGRPLSARERKRLWELLGTVWGELELAEKTTWSGLCRLAAEQLEKGAVPSPFDAVIVDEVQDLTQADLIFLRALVGTGRDGLFLVGDAGQRIYPGGFSLRSLGIDVRGRSRVLRINYRTTEQIQAVADRLLGDVCDDLDEGTESRRGTVSLLRGPDPEFHGFETEPAEQAFVVQTTQRLIRDGLTASEIGLFARTHRLAERFANALRGAGVPAVLLRELGDEADEETDSALSVATMHSAKGLEFKAVFVVGCDDDTVPNAYVLDQIADKTERQSALEQERRLLYVSLTRARDEAFVTWSGKPSRFLEGLHIQETAA